MDVPLYLARLRIQLRSHGFNLPGPRGSAFHGGLGMCLKALDEIAFERCFAPHRESSWPRPYVLLPPLESRGQFMPGDSLNLELTLFNDAIGDWPVFVAALQRLGQIGVGRDRGRFDVSAVWHVTPRDDELLWLPDLGPLAVQPGLAVGAFHPEETTVAGLQVEFVTPLRLKLEGRFLREPPSANLLAERALLRLSQLSETPLPATLREQLRTIPTRIGHADLRWQDWPRWSSRQRQQMPFGGLLGRVVYEGELDQLHPWLHLAQWLHLGGKTSFGLGALRIRTLTCDPRETREAA